MSREKWVLTPRGERVRDGLAWFIITLLAAGAGYRMMQVFL